MNAKKLKLYAISLALTIVIVSFSGCVKSESASDFQDDGGVSTEDCPVGEMRTIDEEQQEIVGVETHTVYDNTIDMCCSVRESDVDRSKTCTGETEDQECTVVFSESGGVITEYCSGL